MAIVKQFRIEEPYLKLDCELGEGPFWEKENNILRFVDIIKREIHTVDLGEGPSSHQLFAQPDISIGTTAEIEGVEDAFAFGGKHGFGIFRKSSKTYEYIKRVWNEEEIKAGYEHRFRGNDGAVDCRGRYWLGMMTDPSIDPEPKPEGVVFRLDPDMSLHRMIENVTIPNGISWSADNKTMYFTDSPTKNIDAFDFDEESGSISNRRPFFSYKGEGVPDGHCQDVHGNFWIAICDGGGKVLEVSQKGDIVTEICLPTTRPTCPAFCGKDLLITTAQEEAPEKYPESAKHGGSVFKFHAGVDGRQLHRFRTDEPI